MLHDFLLWIFGCPPIKWSIILGSSPVHVLVVPAWRTNDQNFEYCSTSARIVLNLVNHERNGISRKKNYLTNTIYIFASVNVNVIIPKDKSKQWNYYLLSNLTDYWSTDSRWFKKNKQKVIWLSIGFGIYPLFQYPIKRFNDPWIRMKSP